MVAGRTRPVTVLLRLPGFALRSAVTWPSGLTSLASVCVCASARVSTWPQWPALQLALVDRTTVRARVCVCRLLLTTWPVRRISFTSV